MATRITTAFRTTWNPFFGVNERVYAVYTCETQSANLPFSEKIGRVHMASVLIFYVIECYVMLEFSNEIQ